MPEPALLISSKHPPLQERALIILISQFPREQGHRVLLGACHALPLLSLLRTMVGY